MKIYTEITTTFDCSLERAFKSPMLCDVCQVHTGYGLTPRVTHCEDDSTWGQIGGSRRIFMAKNIAFKGGEAALDTVLERIENEYWKIEITNVKSFSLGVHTFQGEWWTRENEDGTTNVRYGYTMISDSILLYPLQLFFTKVIWRHYMKQVVKNIKKLAYSKAPYLHD